MKCLIPTLLLLLTLATFAHAQDPFEGAFPPMQNQRPRDTWESQDLRYDTRKQAVRRKAAWKAAQRRQRLEGMKRMGYSPSRPPTSPLPYMSSPNRWIIVPSYYPFSVMYSQRAVAVAPGAFR
ncbi:MAG TPA: hypothetical protein QF564_17335 [Pirellulaceae bacterium]|jgi:hypothetical protein|nr:hypothetical protein [Pirellulaceae bacterium]